MKKALFLSCLLLAVGLCSMAPLPPLPLMTAFNSFTKGGAPSLYTKLDTVNNTGVDSFGSAVDPYHNSIGFQIDVTKISGNPAGAYIQVWGSKNPLQTDGYVLLAVDTIRNLTQQEFNHDICGVSNAIASSGVITVTNTPIAGNPFRWYLLTLQGAGTSSISWRSTLFIR